MPLTPDTRVLLAGAGAQLGGALVARLSGACALTALTRQQLDICSQTAVDAAIRDVSPHVVINCASFNDVDGAEQQAAAALEVNGLGVGHLADACTRVGAHLVHFSTDFVFDPADDPGLLDEAAPVAPRSVYALSKLLGEIMAKRTPRHYVLRVASLFGGARAKSSLDRIADAILAGTTVRAFANRTVTPSYVPDLADATARALERDIPAGLYHCVNTGKTTWVEVARTLAAGLGRDAGTAVVPSTFDPAAYPARRPTFAALSNAALTAAGVPLPPWQDAIARYAAARLAATAGR
ncbi:MAG: NAD(P)-dependent oxidoreductase [Vicinamibacterales bacterium]